MGPWTEEYKKKIIQPKNWESFAKDLRAQGKTLVTLNGSFDLMHAGHLHILFEASKQGDKLLVALNTDESIKEYKSPSRPIIPLQYRLEMMAAIGFVDYVSYFEETTPLRFLKAVKPDIHVNGAEYGKECLEAETVKQGGGKLHIVPLVPGLSTSNIMKKIQQLCD